VLRLVDGDLRASDQSGQLGLRTGFFNRAFDRGFQCINHAAD